METGLKTQQVCPECGSTDLMVGGFGGNYQSQCRACKRHFKKADVRPVPCHFCKNAHPELCASRHNDWMGEGEGFAEDLFGDKAFNVCKSCGERAVKFIRSEVAAITAAMDDGYDPGC